MSPRSTARLLVVALTVASLSCLATPVWAQDGLGGGADFDDEWEAILKLAPPSAAIPDAPQRKAARAEREAGRFGERERTRAAERDETRLRSSKQDEPRERTRTEGRPEKERSAASSALPAERREASPREPTREARAKAEPLARAERRESPTRAEEPIEAAPAKGEQSGYGGLVRSWHEPWPAHAGDVAINNLTGAAPVLSIHPVGKITAPPYVLLPNGKDGGFNEAQIAVASQAFGGWPGGPQVSARLLDLIYGAAKHFDVFHVHLVSGVRNDRSGSRHSHALAADIVLPGVSDEDLAAYFRPQGFVGVGIYTRAGFVHIDVREKSYFWLDKSPPGRRTKIIQVRADEARLADEAAVQRGQNGNANPPRLQKALHARYKRRLEKARASQ